MITCTLPGRFRTGRWAVCVTLLTLLAACVVQGQEPSKTGDSYLWTFQYKKNDTTHMKVLVKIVGKDSAASPEFHASIDQVIRRKVQSVNASGDAVILETIEKSQTTYEGEKQPDNAQAQSSLQGTYSKKGLILKEQTHESGGPLKMDALSTMLHETPVPDMAVKVGDSWKTETTNRMVEGQKLTISSTLIGPEKCLGVDTIKVKVEMKIPPTAGALEKDFISVEGAYNVDPQSGRMIHSEYRMSHVPFTSPTGFALLDVEYATDYLIPGVTAKK